MTSSWLACSPLSSSCIPQADPESGLCALDEMRPDLRTPVVDPVPSDTLGRTYGLGMPEALGPIVVLLAILAIDLWVYADAKRSAAS